MRANLSEQTQLFIYNQLVDIRQCPVSASAARAAVVTTIQRKNGEK
jgi:hypothetical protein